MICEFADIVVVPFPFVDRPVSKRRPALVISSSEFNAANDHTALAMITTATGSAWPSDIAVGGGDETGVLHDSYIRWKLFTLPNRFIARRLGRLSDESRTQVADFAKRTLAPLD